MTEKNLYTPPKVWTWDKPSGGDFARHEKELPVGKHPLQLYSCATPNGIKVTVLLEELLELGVSDAEYDAWLIEFKEGDQFGSGFVEINPNSKIPALLDVSEQPAIRIFESGAILQYLAEYAPDKQEYPINRYTMEVKRQLDVLDRNLATRHYLCGDDYTVADIANYAWYGLLVTNSELYNAQEFLSVQSYKHVTRWAEEIAQRPAVKRGQRVNRAWGPEEDQLRERHSASDFG